MHAAILCLLLANVAMPLAGQTSNPLPANWNEAVHSLVEKVLAALAGSHSITLDVNNISTLPSANASAIQQAVMDELGRHGIRIDATAETRVKLTLSEDPEGYVWVAEVHRGEESQVAIVPASKVSGAGNGLAPSMTLHRTVLWTQPEAMLDFSATPALDGQRTMETALTADRVLLYEATPSGSRALLSTTPIARVQASRDLRGEILNGDPSQLRVIVGNTVCTGPAGARQSLNCSEQPAAGWQFPNGSQTRIEPGRNFFDGLASPDESNAPASPRFFSAAMMSRAGGDSEKILAEMDGKARLYDNSATGSSALTIDGWGDDIATIQTGCDSEWQVLVTGTGDWTEPDQIQIYEIRDHQAIAVGQPLNFPGPILALWPATDVKTARVVSRNLQTGMYEASMVSVTCGN